MSWDHVAVPEDVVQPGDNIHCKIKAVDKDRQRIYFSLKLMEVTSLLTKSIQSRLAPGRQPLSTRCFEAFCGSSQSKLDQFDKKAAVIGWHLHIE